MLISGGYFLITWDPYTTECTIYVYSDERPEQGPLGTRSVGMFCAEVVNRVESSLEPKTGMGTRAEVKWLSDDQAGGHPAEPLTGPCLYLPRLLGGGDDETARWTVNHLTRPMAGK